MGRNLDLLELSTDGRIDPVAWRAAVQADREETDLELEQARGWRCRIRRSSIKWKEACLIQRMARDLVTTRAMKGFATVQDMVRRGWSMGQIHRFGDEAIAQSERLWVLRGVL
jgi:hypothetical protein